VVGTTFHIRIGKTTCVRRSRARATIQTHKLGSLLIVFFSLLLSSRFQTMLSYRRKKNEWDRAKESRELVATIAWIQSREN